MVLLAGCGDATATFSGVCADERVVYTRGARTAAPCNISRRLMSVVMMGAPIEFSCRIGIGVSRLPPALTRGSYHGAPDQS